MDLIRCVVRQFLPAGHLKLPSQKCCGIELRFRVAEFDEAFLLHDLQRRPLL